MRTKFAIAFPLFALFLSAQQRQDASFDEASFRKAVQEGLQPDPEGRAMWFGLAHRDLAVPILVAEIKAKAKSYAPGADPAVDFFILKAADLAIRPSDQRAVDVVADLCATDEKRFSHLIQDVLNGARGYEREYELAYYAIEKYPDLKGHVVDWFKAALKPEYEGRNLALQLLKREKEGHLMRVDDPLLSTLSEETRLRVTIAIERARIELGYRRKQ
jgi:hypothetical protein